MSFADEIARYAPDARRRRPAARPVLEITGLAVDYGYGEHRVHALRGVDLTLHEGEVLGLAGESGCGKSTLVYAATRLLAPPGLIASGEVIYHPEVGEPVDILRQSDDELRASRWEDTALVFQGAMNSLNPVYRIGRQLTDTIAAHRPDTTRAQREERARELLDYTGYAGEYEEEMGIGKPPEHKPILTIPDVLVLAWGGTVPMIAHAAGIELDAITTTWDTWVTDHPIDTARGVVEAGTVAAVRFTIDGIVGGEPRISLEHVNRVGEGSAPDWPRGANDDVYQVLIEGTPSITQAQKILRLYTRKASVKAVTVFLSIPSCASRVVNVAPIIA